MAFAVQADMSADRGICKLSYRSSFGPAQQQLTSPDKAFYNSHIEDFWIPFFANSTNITHSRMEIHRTGYAWRYVRASMTLAGLLPPLSDNGNCE